MEYKPNKTMYITNHRKPDEERIEFDFYATHPDSVTTFLQHGFAIKNLNFQNSKQLVMWEPACGKGNISKVCEEFGYKIFSTDLIDRGYGTGNVDFLKSDLIDPHVNCIITNPPFKQSEQFIRHGLKILPRGSYLCLFLKLTYLEGKKRYSLFKQFPPQNIWLHPSRQGCSPGGEDNFKNGGSVAYCWIIWEKGWQGITSFGWLPPNS